MNKKEILTIETSFSKFEKELKDVQKVKSQFEKSLQLYNDSITGFTKGLAETEGLLDKYLVSASKDPVMILEATKKMQETQMSFNLQYLQLQSQMQHENRAYTAISNIMKTKHDTVKNSISNIR